MSTAAPTRATLAISGMSCSACVRGVTAALSRVPGVTKIDAEIGRAVVEGNTDEALLIAAVEDAGYGARLAADEKQGSMSDGRPGCCC
jgi:copper chaperone CopZ